MTITKVIVDSTPFSEESYENIADMMKADGVKVVYP